MAVLVAAIHVFEPQRQETWIPGTGPAGTKHWACPFIASE